MTLQEARYRLEQQTRKQKAIFFLDAFCWGTAFALTGFLATLWLSGYHIPGMLTGTVAGGLAFAIRSHKTRLFSFNVNKLVQLLHLHYKEYEDSGDLLLADEQTLTTLQRVQQSRTLARFSQGHERLKFPHQLARAALVLAITLVIGFLISRLVPAATSKPSATAEELNPATQAPVALPAAIKTLDIGVNPPVYTGIKEYESTNPMLSIPEGSRVVWSITFSENVTAAYIHTAPADSNKLIQTTGGEFIFGKYFTESAIYRFSWLHPDGTLSSSPYYKIEVTPDQPPAITMVGNLNQFTELTFPQQHEVNVHAKLADDYGLGTAAIIATVSKGSGESIKFREEKLAFTQPARIGGKTADALRTIDLKKLGMEPGDELYFYVEATDNKAPTPNKSRTETYFVQLKDTARQEVSVDAGLGVDIMPDYFRSQRQIIIDTEKLLRERKQLTKQKFNSTSNELGYDQKVLRLKYGEFLGEEAESGIGFHGAPPADDDHEEEDPTKKYGHVHDTENEHNLVPEKKSEAKAEHHHEHEGESGKEASPLEAFAHNHDNAEEATFFIQSIRAKLKAALTVMWDAELQLRLYEPEKSLPYQYQALKLLKEISNDSRVYVHRTGFDPPPIKEDRRLKGDLAETKSSTDNHQLNDQHKLPAIQASVPLLEKYLDKPQHIISPREKQILQQAGAELSGVALKQPGQHLASLSALQDLVQGKTPETGRKDALLLILKSFWQVIPERAPSPSAQVQPWHTLDRKFVDNLNAH
jgi:hypothetical protein